MPKFQWQNLNPDKLWYLVGLITSDGSLSKDRRHIDITSKDFSFLKLVKKKTGLPQKISPKKNSKGSVAHHIQIGSVGFYNFLISIGLTPNKSKTISALKIPEAYFHDFLRGVIDGDGGLRNWKHPTNGNEQWSLRITSGSKLFLVWLSERIVQQMKARGKIHDKNHSKYTFYVLKFGKIAASCICLETYFKDPLSIHLNRKFILAKKCIASRKGWGKSCTVIL
ncbi:MAG: LAGLIDADG family homing endonuclease [Deltaproteobacteria bacterium]|nr:MAG: LAGLIDADG family homing endonuclease [Deltaproteobacteria bacterium]